jgi:hypothetical protein
MKSSGDILISHNSSIGHRFIPNTIVNFEQMLLQIISNQEQIWKNDGVKDFC